MATIREALNRVWAAFRTAGIADDLQILRFSGHLLAAGLPGYADPEAQARLGQALGGALLDQIKADLRQASDLAGGSGPLFDQHILFRLPSMLVGGRYFTPRHIVRHMLNLLAIAPTHRMADFACGSGGFLIHREAAAAENGVLTWGIELAEDMAQLARINAALHGREDVRIEVGNALRILRTGDQWAGRNFDRITMNPPFGERVQTREAGRATGGAVSARSETALTGLALDKLGDGGRAALLVPSGVLFSTSAAESQLRRRLVDEFSLHAVITLPDDAMQPFSQLQTHLLIVAKEQQASGRTWIFREQDDGYPAGRSRDLSADSRPYHDLLLIEAAMNEAITAAGPDPQYSDATWAVYKRDGGDAGRWFTLEAGPAAAIQEIALYPPTNSHGQFLLVALTGEGGAGHWLLPLAAEEAIQPLDDLTKFLKKRYKLRPKESPPQRTVVHAGTPLQCAILMGTGRLLGIQVDTEVFRPRGYDLRPEAYLLQPAEIMGSREAAELLNDIDANRARLNLHVSRLRRYLGRGGGGAAPLPAPLLRSADRSPLTPIGTLSAPQQAIWAAVQRQAAPHPALEGEKIPVPFRPHDIAQVVAQNAAEATTENNGLDGAQNRGEGANETEATLELFERMGLLVATHYAIPEPDNPTSFFRLASQADVGSITTATPDEGGSDG